MFDQELPDYLRKEMEGKKNFALEGAEPVYAGEVLGKGGNSVAYEVEGKPNEVLLEIGGAWKGDSSEEVLQRGLQRLEKKIEMFKKVPENTLAPKILRAWIKDKKLYELMEKAKGREVHNRHGSVEQWQAELELLANAPDEHYAKLIQDVQVLHDVGFQFDPSKPDNFFYDPETGFHIIDLEPGKYIGSMEVPLIHTNFLYTRYSDKITPEIKKSIYSILAKLERVEDLPSQGRIDNIRQYLAEI
jgi:hypothetical protein